MSIKEYLQAARALIADPKHWTTGTFARDVSGAVTNIYASDAVSFCVSGAIRRVANDNSNMMYDALDRFRRAIGGEYVSITQFNDERTHEEVLAALNKAINLS